METNKAVGAYLRTIRVGRGLTQDDVASALNTSARNIGRWESGSHEPGTLTTLDLLNLIRGSAADLQSIVAKNHTEHDAVALANTYLQSNPGQVIVQRAQALFTES